MRIRIKRFSFVYLLVFLFPVFVLADSGKGLLWEISGMQLKQPSYLFGTIHSDKAEVIKLPEKVEKIFNQSDSFSAEVNLDVLSVIQMSQSMMLKDNQKLKSLISTKQYQTSVELMTQRGIPEMIINRMAPWAVAITISLPKQESDIVLDMKLYLDAQKQGKAVYGLETVAEQLFAFNNMPIDDQVKMLEQAIEQHHLLPAMYKELFTAYLERDLGKLQKLEMKYKDEKNSLLDDYLTKELIIKRNYRMQDRMMERLIEGNAFVAVGALHLPGKEGLISLLRKRGFTVRPVY